MSLRMSQSKVRFQKKIGYSKTGSGRLIFETYLWYFDPDTGEWEQLRGDIDWYVSRTKKYGVGDFEVEEGTIIREYHRERGEEPEIRYYIATRDGLKELEEPEKKYVVVDRHGPIELRRLYLVFDIDGRTIEVPEDRYKVVFGGGEKIYFSRDEAEKAMKEIARVTRLQEKYYKMTDIDITIANLIAILERVKTGSTFNKAFGLRRVLKEDLEFAIMLYPHNWPEIKKLIQRFNGVYNSSTRRFKIPLYALADREVMEKIVRKSVEYDRHREAIELLHNMVKELYEKIIRHISNKMGLEPNKIKSIELYDQKVKEDNVTFVFRVKTDYLGKEKFKELAQKYRYITGLGWFIVPLDENTSSELSEMVARYIESLANTKSCYVACLEECSGKILTRHKCIEKCISEC